MPSVMDEMCFGVGDVQQSVRCSCQAGWVSFSQSSGLLKVQVNV